MNPTRLIALVLLVGGVVLLIFGIYQFVEFRDSLGGQLASLGNQINKALGGSSRIAKGYIQPIVMMVAGLVAGVAGFVLLRRS